MPKESLDVVPSKKETPAPEPAPPSQPLPLSPDSVKAALLREEEPAPVPLTSGGRIRPSERLYLEVQTTESLFFYLASQDDLGRLYALFPLPDSGPVNPFKAGSKIRIPETHWLVMDSGGGWERLLLVASREPLPQLEGEMRNPAHPKQLRALERGPLSDQARQRRLEAMAGKEKPFQEPSSGKDPIEDTLCRRLAQAANGFSDQVGVAEGIWVRRIDLENPFR